MSAVFDVVLVLYNNADWLRSCIKALGHSEYDPARLNVILVDNAPSEEMLGVCLDLQRQYPDFGGFNYIPNKKNLGFGAACNIGAAAGSAPYLFFLNVDTEIEPDCLAEIEKGIVAYPEAGAFECRQLPYEMGHHIDPVTLHTPWASGAAMVVERAVFDEAGGFDARIFMYCEDVDLSWRIRATGCPIVYLPRAVVNHYVLGRENTEGASLREYVQSAYGRLLLAYKYGSFATVRAENRRFINTIKKPQHFPGVRRQLLKAYLRHFVKLWPFWLWRQRHRELHHAAPACFAADFAPERGREVLEQRVVAGPMFTVVVRTCARPQVLRGALTSLRHQTYRNFEVVVVEDGPETSRTMIEAEFADLPLRYLNTGTRQGRGKAGNTGLAAAKGEYLNFLDDDDYFYPDHLELMAHRCTQHPDADLVLGCAMVMKVDVKSREPYEYDIKEIELMRFDRLDLFTMSQTCQIPIQSACFKKSLFERCGGLDESMEGNEDWAMWVHFLAQAKRIDPKHIDIHRATSIFLLPADEKGQQERLEKYRIYDAQFFADKGLRFDVTLEDMRGYYDGMIADMRHLQSRGELEAFLEKQANRER